MGMKDTIELFGVNYLSCLCKCCKTFHDKIQESKNLHDNYYEDINLDFLLSEHRRTKFELDNIRKIKAKDNENISKLKSHLKNKITELEPNIQDFFNKLEYEVNYYELRKSQKVKAQ